MPTSFIAQDIMAEHLLSHNAIVFLKDKPMRLRSGLVTPIYVDNRILPSYPEAWRDIVETMASRIVELKLDFDVIAGVEGAGTSHGAALAYRLGVPFVTVRRATKSYGNLSRIDGIDVKSNKVLIIEDHLAITNFDMPETMRNFEKHHITAYQLLPFAFIVEKAEKLGLIDAHEKEQIDAWLDTPWTWAAERGLFAQASEN